MSEYERRKVVFPDTMVSSELVNFIAAQLGKRLWQRGSMKKAIFHAFPYSFCLLPDPGPSLCGSSSWALWVTNCLFNDSHLLICWPHHTWIIRKATFKTRHTSPWDAERLEVTWVLYMLTLRPQYNSSWDLPMTFTQNPSLYPKAQSRMAGTWNE